MVSDARAQDTYQLKENAHKEGTFKCSKYYSVKRVSTVAFEGFEGVPEQSKQSSNLRCSMLTTIMPNNQAVVENKMTTNIAVQSGAIGMIAQVVVPERMLKDEKKFRDSVSFARASFSQSASGQADAVAAAVAAHKKSTKDKKDVDDNSDLEQEEAAALSRHRSGGYKGRRPDAVNIPARPAAFNNSGKFAKDQSPVTAPPAWKSQGSRTARHFDSERMAPHGPLVDRERVDSASLLPSSLSPRWLQNLLRNEPSSASRAKRSGSSSRSRGSAKA